jgi:RsmE family RNA methyltransferase
MNRILFEHHEIESNIAVCSDARAQHIINVLHGEIGQILKTGEINGKIGTGKIVEISKSSEDYTVKIEVNHDTSSLQPWCDLILAPPRPRVLKRLLPQLASLGVGQITLVGAEKTEKDFWGATLLKEENWRPLLIDGLMQAGTTALPSIMVKRNFKKYLAEELELDYPNHNKIVAHPYSLRKPLDVTQKHCQTKILLAIGPEGGWTDREIDLFEEKGFSSFSLGQRILRTDTATIALLAILNPDK